MPGLGKGPRFLAITPASVTGPLVADVLSGLLSSSAVTPEAESARSLACPSAVTITRFPVPPHASPARSTGPPGSRQLPLRVRDVRWGPAVACVPSPLPSHSSPSPPTHPGYTAAFGI